MTQPVYPRSSSASAAFPLPQFMPRTRREVNATDAVNARQFEHWQTNGKHGVYQRHDMNQQVPFYDVMPNSSRSNDRSYRSQPRYDVEAERGVQNPYFNKYDATSDSRNMARELRGSVYEEKHTSYAAESSSIMERNMENRWFLPGGPPMPAPVVEELRPQRDDIQIVYRSVEKK